MYPSSAVEVLEMADCVKSGDELNPRVDKMAAAVEVTGVVVVVGSY